MSQPSGRRTSGHPLAIASLLVAAAGCSPRPQGIVVAAGDDPVHAEPDPVAVTVFTDRVELFMEYPQLVPGLEARFLAHVTVLATGEPVRTGELRLELSRGGAAPVVFVAPRPARDGLFIPVGALAEAGTYAARIVVSSQQVEETIPLEPIIVHADQAALHTAAQAALGPEPPGVVPFLLEVQWKIGLLMERVERRSLTRRLQVPGEIEAPRHASAVISAPLAGRLLPPDSGSLPRLGERVGQGQVLGFVEPPLTVSDSAQLAANWMSLESLEVELLLREADLQTRRLETEQALHQAQARLEFARRSLARSEELRAKDLGTAAELEAARRDEELARRDGESARARAESLRAAEGQLAALRARGAELRSQSAPGGGRLALPLIAPSAGEIVAAEHVQGESLEGGALVYRVLELERVWITAHVSEFDLDRLRAVGGAELRLPAYPERRFDVLGDLDGNLVSFGRVVDPQTRTLPLRFEASNAEGLFHAGMFADLFLETARVVDAVAIPESSIVMDNGLPVAFVLLSGESFQKRDLELGLRDGRWVEVVAGIEAGERVVTRGAYVVRLASTSPATFGHGHAH
jgi:hypothetical protein